MKFIKSFFWLVFILPFGILAQTKATITIQNNSVLERKEAIVAIKWETVLSRYPQIDTTNFVVINPVTKKQIPFQLEHRGLSAIQNLLVQVDVKAKYSLTFLIQKGKPEAFVAKTYARFVPERKDDFAWENDKIAFRAYGKALEKTDGDAYGYDVWVKRTDKLVLNERYKRDDYHIDHGDGLDYYHVGYTLGAGNMAPYVKDTIRYSGNYHLWKVLDNGPLRSTFQLTFDTWDAGGIKVKATKIISLDAGSQLNRIENTYTFDDSKPLPVVVGIIKRPETGVISLNEQQGIMVYWEPTYGEDGTTGVGSILTTPASMMWVDKEQILTKTTVKSNEPIVYYTGAAWDKAAKITDSKKWFDYLDNFYQEIKNPLIIKVE
jgi:ribosomal protein S24E